MYMHVFRVEWCVIFVKCLKASILLFVFIPDYVLTGCQNLSLLILYLIQCVELVQSLWR